MTKSDTPQSKRNIFKDIGEKMWERDGDKVAHVAESHSESECEGWGMGREYRTDEELDEVGDFFFRRQNGDALVNGMIVNVGEIKRVVKSIASICTKLLRHSGEAG